MSTVRIRNAGPEDRDRILAFHLELYVDHRDRVIPQEQLPMIGYRDYAGVLREDVSSLMRRGGALVLVAEMDGEAVGYITGRIENDPRRTLMRRGVVEDWFVSSEGRGEGVGRQLMAALEEHFRRAGCEMMESGTWSLNDGARAAHRSLGFEEIRVTYAKQLNDD